MEELDVLYTVNSCYSDILLASIYSLVINGGIKKLRIHLIVENFTKKDYEKVTKVLDKLPIEYHFYDFNKYTIIKHNIPNWRGSQIGNARLFWQEYLTNNIPHLLYLDADTIVVGNLQNLINYQNSSLNLVREITVKNRYSKLGLNRYFNSGVIFFNTFLWQKENCEEKIIRFLENNKMPLICPDQDVLNLSLKDLISELPLEYNFTTNNALFNELGDFFYYNNPLLDGDLKKVREARKNLKILHSIGLQNIKPWLNNQVNPFNAIYMKYILMANPDFIRHDLQCMQEFWNSHPEFLKFCIIMNSYMPDKVSNMARKLINKKKY